MRRGVPPLRASLSGGGARHGCLNWLSISAERAALKRHRRECAMAMNHSGGHGGHMPATGDRRALVISGWLPGLYFLVEFGIGLWTGSVPVLSAPFPPLSADGGILLALAPPRPGPPGPSPAQTFRLARAAILR